MKSLNRRSMDIVSCEVRHRVVEINSTKTLSEKLAVALLLFPLHGDDSVSRELAGSQFSANEEERQFSAWSQPGAIC